MTVGAPVVHGRIQSLDLLRALAVAAVVLFHYGFRGALPDQNFTTVSLPALAPYAKYGFLGVQLFFVISGFVIAYSAEGRTAAEFAIARIARIYPGFIVCMTVTFLATIFFGAPRFHATIAQWLANTVIASPMARQPFMDGAYWSLVYEMTFYGWVALLLALGWFRRYLAVTIIVWMALAVINYRVGSGVLQRVLLTDESGFFAAGVVIYEMYRGRRDVIIMLLLAIAAMVAVLQSLELTAWSRTHYQTAYNDWAAAGLSLMLIAVVASALAVKRLPLSSSLVLAIGGVTYPIYLLHQQIGYIVFNAASALLPGSILIAATAAAVTVLAFVVWCFIERPGQRAIKRLLRAVVSRLDPSVGRFKPPYAAPAATP